jgi:hypothetical protein
MSLRFGLCAVVGVLSFATPPAHANHIPGATYRGVAATGGTVEFDVSADGSAVTRFVAADVQSNCGGTISKGFTGSLPIVSHAFSSDPADSIRFEGSFPASGQAAGTLLQSSCPNPAVSWTAATQTAAAPPPAPDKTAPALRVRARRSQRLSRAGRIRVRVGCPDEPCRVIADGSVTVQRGGLFRLTPASARLAQGGSVRLEPRLVRRALDAVRRALRNGRRVRVIVMVSAVDGAGNRTVRRLTIRPRPRG